MIKTIKHLGENSFSLQKCDKAPIQSFYVVNLTFLHTLLLKTLIVDT